MELISAPVSENTRFKAKYGRFFITGFVLSVVFHLVVIFFSPEFSIAKIQKKDGTIDVFELPPEIDIPDPPPKIEKPGVPVEADEELQEDITIADTTPEANIPIAPPDDEGPTFTPYDTPPRRIKKTYKIIYPELLRKAGIEGSVVLWLHLDETGKVDKVLVNVSSENPVLDNAAVQGMKTARFTPALQRDTPVPVWIQYIATFKLEN